MTPLLSIQGLRTYIYPSPHPLPSGERERVRGHPVKAVDGVDLEIRPKETLALVGESGCGKTMLALSIGRLLPPLARIVSGRARFQGTDLTSLGEEQLRSIRGGEIAYIFQDPMTALNPVMSVGEQLREAIELHQNLHGKEAWLKGIQLLFQVQIPLPQERIRQYPHQLSGGMRQRVMIAIALAGNPKLLIADEPTTALDVTTQHEILALLKELKEHRGMGVLLITHDLGAVAPHSDRIAVMYAGRIVEVAKTQEFYRNPSHPYAQQLLNCLPKIGQGRQTVQAIPGSVPDLRRIPAGCPFHPRCPEVIDRCRSEEPALKPVREGHTVSCWKREQGIAGHGEPAEP